MPINLLSEQVSSWLRVEFVEKDTKVGLLMLLHLDTGVKGFLLKRSLTYSTPQLLKRAILAFPKEA